MMSCPLDPPAAVAAKRLECVALQRRFALSWVRIVTPTTRRRRREEALPLPFAFLPSIAASSRPPYGNESLKVLFPLTTVSL